MSREDKAVLLAKNEATYSVDAVPTAAANAILTSPVTIELLGSRKTRNAVLPYHGTLPPINVGEGIKIGYSVELRGAGTTPNTPPRIGALIRACGFTETINNTPGSEAATYDPNSSEASESVTQYFYRDGRLHKVLGCVGTFKIGMKTNEIATMDFEFTGLYGGPAQITDTAMATPTFGDAAKPPILRSASFTIQGYAALIEALNLEIGNKIAKRTDANSSTGIYRYFIQGRDVKGDCDPEVVALSTFNPWSQWDQSTEGALSVTVGSTAGNKCVISSPKIVPDIIKYGAREGILTYAYPFTAHPSLTAGNNEIQIKFN